MLKPVKMVKVVGPKEYLATTSEILHRAHTLHIEDPEEDEYFKLGEPLEKASTVSKYLVLLRSYISHLKIDPKEIFPKRKYRVEEVESQIQQKLDEFQREIGTRIDRLKELSDKLKAIEEELKALEPIRVLGISPRLLRGYRYLRCFVGLVRDDPTPKIKEVTSDFEVFIKEFEKEYVVAVFVRKSVEEEVYAILQEYSFRELPVPDVDSIEEKIKELMDEKARIQSEIEAVEKELEDIKAREVEFMLAMEEYLSIELEKAELPLRTLVSKYAFMIVGYVPAKRFEKVKAEVEQSCGGKVILEKLDEEGEPPTLLSNPAYVRDFEILSLTYAVPKYKEIDPTVIMSIFFPLFFGMMLGDMGYGAVLTILALYLKTRYKSEGWQKLLNVALYSGIATIFFGFLYGECFGPFSVEGIAPAKAHFLGSILYAMYAFNNHKPIFDRVAEFGVKSLLFLTLVVGMFKILWGFALGFYNVYKQHGFKEALLEKGTWFIGVLALSLIIFGFSYNLGIFCKAPPEGFGKLLPDNLYVFGHYTIANGAKTPLPIPGMVQGWQAGVNVFYLAALPLLIIGFLLFLKAEVIGSEMGIMGIVMGVELLTWFGQILSYARLLAIGLSSVYFAYVFNYLGLKMALPPGMAILPLGILVIFGGHVINMVLGILDPGLQSLRLHYVEFFTKFFEGGGKLFKPFGRVKRFLVDE